MSISSALAVPGYVSIVAHRVISEEAAASSAYPQFAVSFGRLRNGLDVVSRGQFVEDDVPSATEHSRYRWQMSCRQRHCLPRFDAFLPFVESDSIMHAVDLWAQVSNIDNECKLLYLWTSACDLERLRHLTHSCKLFTRKSKLRAFQRLLRRESLRIANSGDSCYSLLHTNTLILTLINAHQVTLYRNIHPVALTCSLRYPGPIAYDTSHSSSAHFPLFFAL